MLNRLVLAGALIALVLLVPALAFAQDAAHPNAPAPVSTGGAGWGHFSAALAIGLAAFAGALGQSKATAAACEGVARNPGAAAQIRAMAFLGLVLIESLVIYALVIAFVVGGK